MTRLVCMKKQIRKRNNMKSGTIELVLLALLQDGEKYGYQLAQELEKFSEHKYELKEATMYPTLYRLTQNGYLVDRQVKVGPRRTRVYYSITLEGKQYLQHLIDEYFSVTEAVNMILESVK